MMKKLLTVIVTTFLLAFAASAQVDFSGQRPAEPEIVVRQLVSITDTVTVLTKEGIVSAVQVTPQYEVVYCAGDSQLEGRLFYGRPDYFTLDAAVLEVIGVMQDHVLFWDATNTTKIGGFGGIAPNKQPLHIFKPSID